jgi:hypothetical protein
VCQSVIPFDFTALTCQNWRCIKLTFGLVPANVVALHCRKNESRPWGAPVPIQQIHTYLVHPGSGAAATRQINGTQVPLRERLFDLLNNIYSKSEQECDIDIIFKPTDGGVQQNNCRDLICGYLNGPTLINGRAIAELASNRTPTSVRVSVYSFSLREKRVATIRL